MLKLIVIAVCATLACANYYGYGGYGGPIGYHGGYTKVIYHDMKGYGGYGKGYDLGMNFFGLMLNDEWMSILIF